MQEYLARDIRQKEESKILMNHIQNLHFLEYFVNNFGRFWLKSHLPNCVAISHYKAAAYINTFMLSGIAFAYYK